MFIAVSDSGFNGESGHGVILLNLKCVEQAQRMIKIATIHPVNQIIRKIVFKFTAKSLLPLAVFLAAIKFIATDNLTLFCCSVDCPNKKAALLLQ